LDDGKKLVIDTLLLAAPQKVPEIAGSSFRASRTAK